MQRAHSVRLLNGRVVIDVRGDKYSSSVSTLTRARNNFFTVLSCEQWKFERDSAGNSIFIDRDDELFRHVLACSRTGRVSMDSMGDESLQQSLMIQVEEFCFHSLIPILAGPEHKHEEQRRIDAALPDGTLGAGHNATLNEYFGK